MPLSNSRTINVRFVVALEPTDIAEEPNFYIMNWFHISGLVIVLRPMKFSQATPTPVDL